MEQLPTFTFEILVENRFGVLFNITGLFSSRGYNIGAVNGRTGFEPGLSRITMTRALQSGLAEQIVKQLHKQIDVISVEVDGQGDFMANVYYEKHGNPSLIKSGGG